MPNNLHLLLLTLLSCVIVPALRDTSLSLALVGIVGMVWGWEWIRRRVLCAGEEDEEEEEEGKGAAGEGRVKTVVGGVHEKVGEGQQGKGEGLMGKTPIYDAMMREREVFAQEVLNRNERSGREQYVCGKEW